MDWLRRNWPDLLIGIALVAVIAGIIATLISGGSFFPVGQGSRATTPTTQSGSASAGSASTSSPSAATPSASTPAAASPSASSPSTTEPGQAGGDDAAASSTVPAAPGDANAAATPSASPSAAAGTPGDASAASAAPADAGGIAVLPPSDDGAGASSAASPAASTPAASTPAASTPAASSPAGSPSVAPASSVTASATTDEVSYRVSVGAFGNMENAARLAETFRSAGYPVLMGAQGNLNIVLVGPYASEDEARAVAARIRGGDFGVNDPTVYRFDPAEASDPSATTAPSASSGASAPAAASTPSASAAAPAATAGRYLQVGAYATRESSLPQRERLEQLGFSVSERVENDLVKLLVGPFDGAALSEAQARLEAAGIESFAR